MLRNISRRQQAIVDLIRAHGQLSISEIAEQLPDDVSIPTLNRDLANLVSARAIRRSGSGRSTRYSLDSYGRLFIHWDVDWYFETAVDQRQAFRQFDFELISVLGGTPLFSAAEHHELELLHDEYRRNVDSIPPTVYRKEFERLTIELSWKSSEIEGNTYTLLETERLLREHEAASGKSLEEALMLLNHKTCLEYILAYPRLGRKVNLAFIEELHRVLMTGLGISFNLRTQMVGITGSSYQPLDNQHQITEAVQKMCECVAGKQFVFERALIAILLTSYIQPFEDGNKRTARMLSNAIMVASDACPLSYRSVDAIEYKKAMLLFYEQHNVAAFKELFLEQVEFAVRNYFR